MKRTANLYRFGIALLALFFSALALWYDLPTTEKGILSVLVGLCFLILAAFPIYIGNTRITLIPLLAFPVGLFLGPGLALLGIALGTLFGSFIRLSPKKPRFTWQQACFEFGLAVIPLAAVYTFHGVQGYFSPVVWQDYIMLGSIYAGAYLLIRGIEFLLHQPLWSLQALRTCMPALLISLAPIPVTLIASPIFRMFGEITLVGMGFLIALISVVLHRMGITRQLLERRLQELFTLNVISKSVSATLKLEDLLEILHKNVTQLLGIDNFYIALIDRETNEVWYPIAIKHGERRNWPRRPPMDRLTDQVITRQHPLLFASHATVEIARIGMPASDDALYAWMGVPLFSGNTAIGCMGVFSISPRVEFTQADLDFLVTISGQVSVAIENALLYEKTQRRSKQLETLNWLSGQVSTSLDLPQVLVQICKGAMRISEAPMAAIFLRSPEEHYKLEHAEGFLPDNLPQLEKILVNHWRQSSPTATGRPVLVTEPSTLALSDKEVAVLQAEKIHAWGSFMLSASGDEIGFLSICYSESCHLDNDVIELLQAFTSQAALAVTNATLYAATDMALANRVHQLAILETIGRRLLAHFDADRLFEMILDYAIDFTRSPWGFLGIYRSGSEYLEIKAGRGYRTVRTVWPVDQGITGKALKTRKPINVSDTSQDPDFIDATEGQTKSQLSVPLIYEGQVLGVITLESDQPNAFDLDDQSLVMQLANYAALAVNNAQLYGELQRRLREQSTLYVVTSHLVGTIDPENLLRVIGEAIQTAIRPIRTGLYLREEGADGYVLMHCVPSEDTHLLPPRLAQALLNDLVPISIKVDILKIPHRLVDQANTLQQNKDQKALVIRLAGAGQDLGMILLHLPTERSLQSDEIKLLQAIIVQGAIALQNALLFADFVQARERLSAILNTVEEGILLVDVHGAIVLANHPIETNTGLSLGQALNKKLHDLPAPVLKILGFTIDQARELVDQLDKGRLIESPKTTVVLTDSKPERVLERSLTPVLSQLGAVIGIMIVLRDMTEEHQIEKTRETITDTLIHDLRSPISAVMSALDILSELLKTDGQEGEMIGQAMRVAQRSSEKVYNLVSSLLEIARMQSGDIDLNIQPLALYDLASEVSADYALQANEYGIILSNEIPPNFPMAMADHAMIERVFANLIDNALKFTPGGGRVRMTARIGADAKLIISIADNGPGIPAEFHEKIFDRFSQIPNQSSRRRGTGLGLAFCRLVIEGHGGEIWVEPNTPFGSIFSFSLPAA